LHLLDYNGILSIIGIPLSSTPSALLSDEGYLQKASSYMSALIIQGINHPSIMGWTVGNNLIIRDKDVQKYIKNMKEGIDKLDSRPLFVTTLMSDEIWDNPLPVITLLHITEKSLNDSFKSLKFKGLDTSPPYPVILEFGAASSAVEDNKASDIQALKLSKFIEFVDGDERFAGWIVRSFSDWTGQLPHLYSFDPVSPFLSTDGITTLERKEKISYRLIKNLIEGKKDELSLKGSHAAEMDYVFLLWGIFIVLLFTLFFKTSEEFRNLSAKVVFSSKHLFREIEEDRIFSFRPVVISMLLSSGSLGLSIAQIISVLRGSIFFDYLITIIFPSPAHKLVIVKIFSSNISLILFSTLLTLLILSGLTLYFKVYSKIIKRGISFKKIARYIGIPSTVFLALIPLSIIVYKQTVIQSFYWLQWSFTVILLLIYLGLLYSGYKIIFSPRSPFELLIPPGVLIITAFLILSYLQILRLYVDHLRFALKLWGY
ncbi:MAG: hypothetical protein ACE5QV_03495, partial [Fidelibacterota bacterium]